MQVPKIIKKNYIIHLPPLDAAAAPLQTVTFRAFVVLAATVVVEVMVVQVRVTPKVGRVVERHQAVATCQSHEEVPGGGDERVMPPGPGGVVDAAIDTDNAIDEEYREPPHPPGLIAIR